MNEKLSSKGMMVDITARRSFAKQLIDQGKDYDQRKHSVNSILFHVKRASCYESFSKTFGEL